VNTDSEAEAASPPEPPFDLQSATSPSPKGWRAVYVYAVFGLLLVGWPILAIISQANDQGQLSELVGKERLVIYANTAGILWIVFVMVWSAQRVARRPISELGFTEPRWTDPFIALAFLFVSNLTLNGLSSVLGWFGMEAPELTIKGLLPVTGSERIAWIMMSISAGVCEESCFRGFLLLRGKGWLGRWWPIVILSSIAFGLGHLYEGSSGAILVCIYGVMFCGLRLWRGSLWPGIWAHIWQDIGAMMLGGWGP
jgi:membrane protease YdiL (CAAX protease family)